MELESIGQAFVDALVARDFPALRAAVTDDVRFRLLVPKGPQAEAGAADTVGRFVGWFAGADHLELEESSVRSVAGRLAITYRFLLHDPEGWRVIEQHLMVNLIDDGRARAIDLLCSGFRPLHDPVPGGLHDDERPAQTVALA